MKQEHCFTNMGNEGIFYAGQVGQVIAFREDHLGKAQAGAFLQPLFQPATGAHFPGEGDFPQQGGVGGQRQVRKGGGDA